MKQSIQAPLIKEEIRSLHAGDSVLITGTIYTARDAAHKRMQEALKNGEKLPLAMEGNVIYYMGPSPAREGRPIGSAGPTTASRMDKYAPELLDLGLKGMIGKGKRSKSILSSEVIAYDDLGTEAIRKLEVKDFPAIVVIDKDGNNLYETAVKEYNTLS